MGNPSLHSIHVHPLKAARGFAPDEAVVEPWGLAGDRRWVLVDDSGKVITQRPHPRMALAAAGLLPGGGVLVYAGRRTP
ncbi:MOSC N-terminal beta barrel domain-containing protein, partial [Streptomyces sp. NPDC057474]|uniref:MOSC N-terminal beta barrel domain-containing protein n=1 Tax=Streptomyces sp. NPDC057474 TaxID=3346144 RepID=UPI00369F8DBA